MTTNNEEVKAGEQLETTAKTGELVTGQTGALARPDFIPRSQEGTDNIGIDDLRIPRLALAQKTSNQIDPSHSKYIEGLKFLDLFNDVTGRIYGRGPLTAVVLRADPPKHIEFKPMSEGGGVVDMDVPPNDPRTMFRKDAQGKSLPPIATKFYEYILMLLHPNEKPELIALSLKSTGIKTAKALNSLIKLREADIYAGMYRITTDTETNKYGTFGVFSIVNAGFVPTQEMYDFMKKKAHEVAGKALVIDREPGDEVPGDDKVPF